MDYLSLQNPVSKWLVLLVAVCLLGLSQSGQAQAADSDSSGHREFGVHAHGKGTLNIVLDGQDLLLELLLPAVNVVGFEHHAKSLADKEIVSQAMASVQQVAKLFVPSQNAGCEIENVNVSLDGMPASEQGSPAPEAQPKHSDGHQHSSHSISRDDEHADFIGVYEFHCDQPSLLTELEVRAFGVLSTLEELTVQLVTPTIQLVRTLTPEASVLKLSR